MNSIPQSRATLAKQSSNTTAYTNTEMLLSRPGIKFIFGSILSRDTERLGRRDDLPTPSAFRYGKRPANYLAVMRVEIHAEAIICSPTDLVDYVCYCNYIGY